MPVVAIEKLKNQTLLNFAVNFDFDLENSKLIRSETKESPASVYDVHFKDVFAAIKTGKKDIQGKAYET